MIRELTIRLRSRSPRERRALWLGATAIGIWVLANGVARPYLSGLAGRREHLAREQELLARESTLLAQSGAFAARYAMIERTTLDEAPRLFSGSDLLAASTSLAAYVGGQAAVHRVMVQQTEARPAQDAGSGTAALGVDIRAVSDLQGIAGFLYALEHGPKLVRIEQLLVTPVPAPSQADEETLALVAMVRGYALNDSTDVHQTTLGARP